MEHLKQERTAELSTRGFTTIAKLKTMLEKLGIKLTKKSMRKAELIHTGRARCTPFISNATTPYCPTTAALDRVSFARLCATKAPRFWGWVPF